MATGTLSALEGSFNYPSRALSVHVAMHYPSRALSVHVAMNNPSRALSVHVAMNYPSRALSVHVAMNYPSRALSDDRQYNGKKDKKNPIIYKTLYRKLKKKQQEH
jgi:hypothetical protein